MTDIYAPRPTDRPILAAFRVWLTAYRNCCNPPADATPAQEDGLVALAAVHEKTLCDMPGATVADSLLKVYAYSSTGYGIDTSPAGSALPAELQSFMESIR